MKDRTGTGARRGGSGGMKEMPDRRFFARDARIVAAELIGMELRVGEAAGIIVETEAYLADDPASHSFRGPTARNASMFCDSGTSYVYRIYGMHWCLNAVCLPGAAVLLRALEPVAGLDLMRIRRGVEDTRLLCSGPGRLAQALAIGGNHDGMSFLSPPFALHPGLGRAEVVTGPRIGISRAADVPWRFGLARSPFLSRRFA